MQLAIRGLLGQVGQYGRMIYLVITVFLAAVIWYAFGGDL